MLSLNEIESKVSRSIGFLKKNDQVLLDNNTNERTIAHKLAEYLQQEFQGLNVDCEYNRYEGYIKRIEVQKNIKRPNWDDVESTTVFPDIVVHHRGNQRENVLIVEIKKSSNKSKSREDFDKIKIKALMGDPYSYMYGLFLRIGVNGDQDSLEWFP